MVPCLDIYHLAKDTAFSRHFGEYGTEQASRITLPSERGIGLDQPKRTGYEGAFFILPGQLLDGYTGGVDSQLEVVIRMRIGASLAREKVAYLHRWP